jgi:hypothetical protein
VHEHTILDVIIDRLINGQPAQVYIMTEYEDPDRDADLETCVDCNGRGVDVDDEPCEWCMGTGVVRP